jgi:hypothetical protein
VRKLFNEELRDCHVSQKIIRVIKLSWMRWAERVVPHEGGEKRIQSSGGKT